MHWILDTSAYSHFMRGHEGVVRVLDQAEWIGEPAIVLGELLAGFRRGSRFRKNETERASSSITLLSKCSKSTREWLKPTQRFSTT